MLIYYKSSYVGIQCLTLSKTTNFLYPFKLKKFADGNSKFNENSIKFSKSVENTEEKGEIARYEQFLIFLQCF